MAHSTNRRRVATCPEYAIFDKQFSELGFGAELLDEQIEVGSVRDPVQTLLVRGGRSNSKQEHLGVIECDPDGVASAIVITRDGTARTLQYGPDKRVVSQPIAMDMAQRMIGRVVGGALAELPQWVLAAA